MASAAGRPHLDHLLVGAADLESAVEELARATGVRPVYGGRHPRGTHNALVALDGGAYLELVAVEPGATRPASFPELSPAHGLVPIGWAVAGGELAELRAAIAGAGFALTEPKPGSRLTPAGATLEWRTFGLATQLINGPFFIAWSPATPHPSTTSPAGCSLRSFAIASPDAEPLRRLATALALPVEILESSRAAAAIELDGLKGRVLLRTGEFP
ncbi:MAG: VOC family protein [Thermoanaerobaculia bacterium]